jgi:hypothetical protein
MPTKFPLLSSDSTQIPWASFSILLSSVEMAGFEPAAFALQRRCSPAELHPQASRTPVGLTGFEPVTPALSAQCSNHLSYKPIKFYPQQLNSDRKYFFLTSFFTTPSTAPVVDFF